MFCSDFFFFLSCLSLSANSLITYTCSSVCPCCPPSSSPSRVVFVGLSLVSSFYCPPVLVPWFPMFYVVVFLCRCCQRQTKTWKLGPWRLRLRRWQNTYWGTDTNCLWISVCTVIRLCYKWNFSQLNFVKQSNTPVNSKMCVGSVNNKKILLFLELSKLML